MDNPALIQSQGHIVYVGGLDKSGKESKDTRTPAQLKTMEAWVHRIITFHPEIKGAGHNQFYNKDCPSFFVPQWLKSVGVGDKTFSSNENAWHHRIGTCCIGQAKYPHWVMSSTTYMTAMVCLNKPDHRWWSEWYLRHAQPHGRNCPWYIGWHGKSFFQTQRQFTGRNIAQWLEPCVPSFPVRERCNWDRADQKAIAQLGRPQTRDWLRLHERCTLQPFASPKKIPHAFRKATYNEETGWQHVYVIVPKKGVSLNDFIGSKKVAPRQILRARLRSGQVRLRSTTSKKIWQGYENTIPQRSCRASDAAAIKPVEFISQKHRAILPVRKGMLVCEHWFSLWRDAACDRWWSRPFEVLYFHNLVKFF